MTNLVAIVTVLAINNSELKTNVIESAFDPARNQTYFVDVNSYYINERLPHPPAPPAEKWVTTIITKEDNLSFVWMDQTNVIKHSQVVCSNTVHLRVKQEWEPVK